VAKPNKPGARRKPSASKRPSSLTPRTPTSEEGTSQWVTYACDPLTNTYPEAPSGLIDILQGVQRLSPGLARGRILIAIEDEG
jgi:hypothetical protein